MAKSKENVAEKESSLTLHNSGGAVAPISDFASSMESYIEENGDSSDFKAEDLITPRVRILQALSPQLKKQKAEYVEGSQEGQIFNTASQKLIDGGTGVNVVVCYSQPIEWVEWIPKSAGGGLVKRWGTDETFMASTREEKGRYVNDATGTETTKSANYFVLIIDEHGAANPAIITFSGTDFKKSRKWNTELSLKDYFIKDKGSLDEAVGRYVTPPPFYKVFNLTTIPESNDSGDWYGWRVTKTGTIDTIKNGRYIWDLAADFRKLVSEGKLVVQTEEPQETVINNDKTDAGI